MPIEQLVPQQPILWDVMYFWPPRVGLTNSSTTADSSDITGGRGAKVEGVSPNSIITAPTGGAQGFAQHAELLYNAFRFQHGGPAGTPGILGLGVMRLALFNLRAADFAPGVGVSPESQRFTWLRQYFDFRGGNMTDQTGLVMGAWTQPVSTYWFGSVAAPLFGIIGDGAGGLQWRSQTAAGAIIETVAVPGGIFVPTTVNVLEWRCLSGSPTRDASIDVLLNGVSIVSRNWTTAPALGLPGAGGNDGLPGHPWIRVLENDATHQMFIFGVDYRSGAWDQEGIPVIS